MLGVAAGRGTSNQKRLPAPSSLFAPITPPISSTSCLLIASPSPFPEYLRVVEESACVNGSNIRSSIRLFDADSGVDYLEADALRALGYGGAYANRDGALDCELDCVASRHPSGPAVGVCCHRAHVPEAADLFQA